MEVSEGIGKRWTMIMNDPGLKIHKWIAWSGPVLILGYLVCWAVLGHNIPPPDPSYTAQQLVDNYYVKYQSDILLGQSLSAFFGLIYLPWTCVIAIQMRRREKEPLLAYINLTGGILNAWVLASCPAMWAYAAEVAGKVDPELVKTIHFVAWYVFDMTYMVASLQGFAIGIFALCYRQEPVLYPVWVGWVAIFMAASFLPLSFIPYFKTGPIAINGLWSFHVVFLSFLVFCVGYSYYMLKEASRVRISPVQGVGQAVSYN